MALLPRDRLLVQSLLFNKNHSVFLRNVGCRKIPVGADDSGCEIAVSPANFHSSGCTELAVFAYRFLIPNEIVGGSVWTFLCGQREALGPQ